MLRFLSSHAISVRELFVKAPQPSRLRTRPSSIPSLFIYRRHPTDFQIATFTRSPTNFKYKDPKEREPCPIPEPPPPPPPKDDKLLWGTIALLFITGGFVVYAKGSPEIRDWLTLNAPWFDDLIAVLYQENMTYGEFASSCVDNTKKFIDDLRGVNKPKKCSIDGGPVIDVPEEPKEKDGDVEVCVKEPPPVITKSICEIEKCVIEVSECVINNYNTAKDACACYNLLVEDTMQTFTYKGMKDLRHAMEERIELVKKSLDNASACIDKLDQMIGYLDCGVQATKNEINNVKLLHRDFHEKFKACFIAYQWENDLSTVWDTHWQLIEELVNKYTLENESVFTGLKYSAKRPHTYGDLDLLFTNSFRYIEQLEKQLKDVSPGMTERVNRALEELPQTAEAEKARAVMMANALKDKRIESEKDYKRREEEQKKLNEKILKDSLKKLNDKHTATLGERLADIEKEVMEKFNRMVAEHVAAEKRTQAKELQDMARNLAILEDKLRVRLKVERETRRSQELWAAGASLLAATKKGDPYVKVDRELKAIEKASGDGDKLVLTVLKSIPKSVREKGIVPESVLRDSFRVMEKTARSVALIEQEGATMPVYMLSWLQGLLLFMRMSGIPQLEFEKPPLQPPTHLDTFDLLQRARFWVERGNLAVAVRYVDSLKGASRAAAAKWFEEARAHVEVRQAAEAILAHAAAMGLQYI